MPNYNKTGITGKQIQRQIDKDQQPLIDDRRTLAKRIEKQPLHTKESSKHHMGNIKKLYLRELRGVPLLYTPFMSSGCRASTAMRLTIISGKT